MGVLIWFCEYIEKGKIVSELCLGNYFFFCKQKLFCMTPDFSQTTVCGDWVMVCQSFTYILLCCL